MNGKGLSTIGTNGALTGHQAKPTNVKGESYGPRSESPRPEQLQMLHRTRQYHLLTSPCLGGVLSVPQVTTKWNDILAGAPEPQEVLNVNDWLIMTRVAPDAIAEGESGLTVTSCYLLSLVI